MVQLMAHALSHYRRLVLPCVGLLVALVLYGLTVPIEIQQEASDGPAAIISHGSQTGQSFVAYFPGLNQITLETRGISDGRNLSFELRDGQRRLVSSEDAQIGIHGDRVAIRFDPPVYAVPAELTFTVRNVSEDKIEVAADSRNMYPEGERTDAPGDLMFSADFRPGPIAALSLLPRRLADHKPGAAGQRWTYVLLLAALATTFLGFSCAFIRSLVDAGSPHGKL